MSETLLATLLEGLIYVLAKEARARDIDVIHEAQCANFDEDLLEFVSQVTKNIDNEEKSLLCEDKRCSARVTDDIEEDTKVAIDILPLSKKDEPCDTLQLPNGKVPQLEETTPNKTGVKVELNVDSEQAKDLKPKVSDKGILAEMGESFLSSGLQTSPPLLQPSLTTGVPPQTPPLVIKKPRLFLILVILLSPQNWSLIKNDSPNFAELGATDALFPPYSTPLAAYVCISLAQVAWSKVPSRSWVFRLDPSRPIIGCRQTGSTCVLATLVSLHRTTGPGELKKQIEEADTNNKYLISFSRSFIERSPGKVCIGL